MGLTVSNTVRHSRERGNPDFQQSHLRKAWIPAFAGMTGFKMGKIP
jgi:hypothetical protein